MRAVSARAWLTLWTVALCFAVYGSGCGPSTTTPSHPDAPEPVAVPADVAEAFKAVQAFRYEPYAGVQRGAAGTEEARAGNSADQALALAARLTQLGHTARIAAGTLDDAALSKLLATLTPEGFEPPDLGDAARPRYVALEDERITSAARLHHWVEVEHDGDWIALDPSYRTAVTGQQLTEPTERPAPDAIAHQRVTLVLKQEAGGKTQELGRFEGNTAALRSRRISLEMRGTPRMKDPPAGSAPAPKPSGGLLGGGLGGALTGGRKPAPKPKPEGAPARPGEIDSITYTHQLVVDGKPVAMKGATFKRGGIDRQWLEITITVPGQAPHVVDQPLYDRVGSEEPPLFRRVELAVVTGPLREDQLEAASNAHRAALARAPDDHAAVSAASKKSDDKPNVKAARKSEASAGVTGFLTALRMAHASDLLTASLGRRGAVTPVYALPRVLAVHTASARKKASMSTTTSLDLRLDRVLAVPHAGAPAKVAALFYGARGMAESELEGEVLSATLGGRPVVTTARLMREANRTKVPTQVVTSENTEALKSISGLAPNDRQRIERAVAAGHDVIIPKRAVPMNGKRRLGWWEVSSSTGEMIGVMEGGLHQATMDYGVKLNAIGLNPAMGYVFGSLAGALAVHTLAAAELLKNHRITEEAKKRMKKQIFTYACAVCPGINLSITVDATYKSDCFGFRQSAKWYSSKKNKWYTAGWGGRLGIDFCKGYAKGMKCSVGLLLDGIEKTYAVEVDDDNTGFNGHWEHPLNCEERAGNTNVDHDL